MLSDALTPALDALRTRLTAQSYALTPRSLSGSHLSSLLEAYLQVPGGALAVTGGCLDTSEGRLVLSGTATVLGIPDAQLTVTFLDSVGGDSEDVRGIDMLVQVRPARLAAWSFGQSFPQLAGTLFDELAVADPTLVACSRAYLPVQSSWAGSLPMCFGLSLAGTVRLTGPLEPLQGLLGDDPHAGRQFYGPLAFTAGWTPLAALTFSTELSGHPSGSGLDVTLRSRPTAAGGVSAEVLLSTRMSLAGIDGSLPLTGKLPAVPGPLDLRYDFARSPTVGIGTLVDPWGFERSVTGALPHSLYGENFALAAVGMRLSAGPRRPVDLISLELASTTGDSRHLTLEFPPDGPVRCGVSGPPPRRRAGEIVGWTMAGAAAVVALYGARRRRRRPTCRKPRT